MRPCIAWSGRRDRCVAALLHGASCCPDGGCALCRGAERRLRLSGRNDTEVSAAMLATWYTTLERCPICGNQPPPPVARLPALPEFARLSAFGIICGSCIVCGGSLPPRHVATCGEECALEFRAEKEGWEFQGLSEGRVLREYRSSIRVSGSPD